MAGRNERDDKYREALDNFFALDSDTMDVKELVEAVIAKQHGSVEDIPDMLETNNTVYAIFRNLDPLDSDFNSKLVYCWGFDSLNVSRSQGSQANVYAVVLYDFDSTFIPFELTEDSIKDAIDEQLGEKSRRLRDSELKIHQLPVHRFDYNQR